jgi:hypothetical protein
MASKDAGAIWLEIRTAQGKIAGSSVQRLIGFWVLWHTFGGLDDLATAGVISRTGVYTQRKEFRLVFGVDVAEFQPELAAQFAARRAPKSRQGSKR